MTTGTAQASRPLLQRRHSLLRHTHQHLHAHPDGYFARQHATSKLVVELKQKRLLEQEIVGLVGHATGSMTFDRYGKPYNPGLLLEVLKKVDFEHILQHVHKWAE